VLLPTLGSAGDVHPFIALALALQARGHRATLLTNPLFQPLIERCGVGFQAVGSDESARAAINNPDIWHPRRGLPLVLKIMASAVAEVFSILERCADANTVVAASSLALGARIAQDKLGLPTATVHLQPSVLRTLEGPLVLSPWQPRWQPRWSKAAVFWLIDRGWIDPVLQPPVNALRSKLGLRPVDRLMRHWVHSPQCVLAMFPSWFAPPREDWPPSTYLIGFPLWDAREMPVSVMPESTEATASADELEAFLASGEAPVVVTAGSAAATLHQFFSESVRALRALNRRALLVTNFPHQLPSGLPSTMLATGYVPFSAVLPHAALLIHHGGIGTLAQAVAAGTPQLMVPRAFDQFDNAARIERLGLGRGLAESRYRAAAAAAVIRQMLQDAPMRAQCREYAARIDSAAALSTACEHLEALRSQPLGRVATVS
jgi:rhamnosyltransferase subunit B